MNAIRMYCTIRHHPKLKRIGDGPSGEGGEVEAEASKVGEGSSRDKSSLSKDTNRDALLRGVYQEELALSVDCIKRNPKSYPAWHHRKWALERGLGLLGER